MLCVRAPLLQAPPRPQKAPSPPLAEASIVQASPEASPPLKKGRFSPHTDIFKRTGLNHASWQEVCAKKWPKTMAQGPLREMAESMGYEEYFHWRVLNREEHIEEAFGLALKGDADGLRQMRDAGKSINGVFPFVGRKDSPMPHYSCCWHSICGECAGDDGQSVLHAAVWNGAIDAVQVLLEADEVDLDACTRLGFTPLHYAAERGESSADVCKLLVESGAHHETYTVVTMYSRCTLAGCRHTALKDDFFCGGMPVDTAKGRAREYLESLSYERLRRLGQAAPS